MSTPRARSFFDAVSCRCGLEQRTVDRIAGTLKLTEKR
jgi:hypothetical protein